MAFQTSSDTWPCGSDGDQETTLPRAMPVRLLCASGGGYFQPESYDAAPVYVVLRLSGEPGVCRTDTPPATADKTVGQGDDIPIIHFQVDKDVLIYVREVTCIKTARSSNEFARSPFLERLSSVLDAAGLRTNSQQCGAGNAIRLLLVASMLDVQPPPAPPSRRRVLGPALASWQLKRVLDYIDAHIAGPIRLADLAAVAGLSRMYFASRFRVATGMRPHDCILRRRVEHAQKLLITTSDSLVEIALSVGFETQAHFTTVFKKYAGDTPNRWRRREVSAALSGVVRQGCGQGSTRPEQTRCVNAQSSCSRIQYPDE